MSDNVQTLGTTISQKRKEKGLSQKQLAELIKSADGERQISPQYLNDIEHDRRTPSSDHMIRQFAEILDIKEDYVFFLADRIPSRLKMLHPTEEAVHHFVQRATEAAVAFRKNPRSPK